MYLKRFLLSAAFVAALLAAPATASADWLITPFLGANFGGSANFGDFNDFEDEFEQRMDLGVSLGYMGRGIAGFEIDFGWSPNFFENTAGTGDFEFGDNNVTTLMGNLLIGAPIGGQTGPGVRPYGAVGLGMVRTRIDGGEFFNDLSTNDFGFNVGGGINAFFTDNVGIRGDIRYFRSFSDDQPDDEFDLALSDFDFWRATVGFTFRFGG
jgi:opacity protein-like surface antigen